MSKAIRFNEFGGPEVLRWMDVDISEPGPGEVRIRHHAIGVNFIDVYQRTGLYPVPLPATVGNEGAGVVEAVGEGVPVVYDAVGKDTFESSLKCLRPYGLLVSFGNASGPVPPVDLGILTQLGSLYVTRPSLLTYTAKPADLTAMATELFGAVTSGNVRIDIKQRYQLKDAAQAHRDLEARRTTGSSILLPD